MAPADEATTGEQRAGDSPRPAVPDTAQVAASGLGGNVRPCAAGRLHDCTLCRLAQSHSQAGAAPTPPRVLAELSCTAWLPVCSAVPCPAACLLDLCRTSTSFWA